MTKIESALQIVDSYETYHAVKIPIETFEP